MQPDMGRVAPDWNSTLVSREYVSLLSSTFGRLVEQPSFVASSNETAYRMNVNQISFAILISVLLVADMFLIWSLGYIVIFYEQRGRIALKHYGAVRRHKLDKESVNG